MPRTTHRFPIAETRVGDPLTTFPITPADGLLRSERQHRPLGHVGKASDALRARRWELRRAKKRRFQIAPIQMCPRWQRAQDVTGQRKEDPRTKGRRKHTIHVAFGQDQVHNVCMPVDRIGESPNDTFYLPTVALPGPTEGLLRGSRPGTKDGSGWRPGIGTMDMRAFVRDPSGSRIRAGGEGAEDRRREALQGMAGDARNLEEGPWRRRVTGRRRGSGG